MSPGTALWDRLLIYLDGESEQLASQPGVKNRHKVKIHTREPAKTSNKQICESKQMDESVRSHKVQNSELKPGQTGAGNLTCETKI